MILFNLSQNLIPSKKKYGLWHSKFLWDCRSTFSACLLSVLSWSSFLTAIIFTTTKVLHCSNSQRSLPGAINKILSPRILNLNLPITGKTTCPCVYHAHLESQIETASEFSRWTFSLCLFHSCSSIHIRNSASLLFSVCSKDLCTNLFSNSAARSQDVM